MIVSSQCYCASKVPNSEVEVPILMISSLLYVVMQGLTTFARLATNSEYTATLFTFP